MTKVRVTRVPGFGTRCVLTTQDARRVGVIQHDDGHQELFIGHADDPDAAAASARLDPHEAEQLARILRGEIHPDGATADPHLPAELGMTWLTIREPSALSGQPLSRTPLWNVPVTLAAAVRDGEVLTPPAATFVPRPGDRLLLFGAPDAITEARRLAALT